MAEFDLIVKNASIVDVSAGSTGVIGELVAVGDSADGTAASNAGAVRFHDKSTLSPTVTRFGSESNERLGGLGIGTKGIAFFNGELVVCAQGYNSGEGAVRRYDTSGDLTVVFQPADIQASDVFGKSAHANNDFIAITSNAAVYVYDTAWALVIKITPTLSGGVVRHVAVNSSFVAIGSDNGAGDEEVQLFTHAGGLVGTFASITNLGSIAINEQFLFIGDDGDFGTDGTVYVYDMTMAPVTTLSPTGGQDFGYNMAANSTRVAVAKGEWSNADSNGAVYIYDMNFDLLTTLFGDAPADSFDSFGFGVSITEDRMLVMAYESSGTALYQYEIDYVPPASTTGFWENLSLNVEQGAS